MNGRILITGGAGFIGSHLTRRYLSEGLRVMIYDNFLAGKPEFLPDDPSLNCEKGDILDSGSLSDAVKKWRPDVVYHLAAIHDHESFTATPEKTLKVNIEGTRSLLEACEANRIKKVVFASTGGVYEINDGPIAETWRRKPYDVYCRSKIEGEDLVARYSSIPGTSAVTVRLFNIVGPNETSRHIIPDILRQVSRGIHEIALGNLDTRRDYTHVIDAAEALYRIGMAPKMSDYEVFNVGSGVEYSVREAVMICGEVTGSGLKAVSTPGKSRETDRPSLLADIGKIMRVFGWSPARTFRDAVRDAWEYEMRKVTI